MGWKRGRTKKKNEKEDKCLVGENFHSPQITRIYVSWLVSGTLSKFSH